MEELVAALLLILPIPSLVATGYIWRIYFEDDRRPRSWLLWMLAVGATVKLVAGCYFAALAFYRLAISITLPADTRGLSGLMVILLLGAPIAYALQIERRRRLG